MNYLESESNNSISTANLIPIGATVSANLPSRDIDYFKYQVSTSGVLRFAVDLPATSGAKWEFKILNSSGAIVNEFTGWGGARPNTETIDHIVSPGTYYLSVTPVFTSSSMYSVTTSMSSTTSIPVVTTPAVTTPVDIIAPRVSAFGSSNATVGVGKNLQFIFTEPIQKGFGVISIRSGSATGPLVEQLDISTSNKVTLDGGIYGIRNLNISLSALSESTTYFVVMGPTVIKDLSGNYFEGGEVNAYSFKTVKSVFDHLFATNVGYSVRYETTDIRVPGTVIAGSLGDDDLYGTPGVDYVAGYRGLDVILTYGGNDVIYPSINKSNGDAGDGIDTLMIGRTLSNSTIEPYLFRNPDAVLSTGVSVKNKADPNVFASFNNLERINFLDTNIALDIAPSQNAGSVYMLYKAAFNRAPDASGMGYWLAQKDAGANIVTSIAQGFVTAPEFIAKYGANPSNADYVNKLYQNVLGRAGESGGVTYWNQELDAGRISKAAVLVQFATLPEGAALVANLIANGIPYQEWVA